MSLGDVSVADLGGGNSNIFYFHPCWLGYVTSNLSVLWGLFHKPLNFRIPEPEPIRMMFSRDNWAYPDPNVPRHGEIPI